LIGALEPAIDRASSHGAVDALYRGVVAQLTPLSSRAVAELARDVGFPPGVVNVIPGYGKTAGQRLAEHERVSKIRAPLAVAADHDFGARARPAAVCTAAVSTAAVSTGETPHTRRSRGSQGPSSAASAAYPSTCEGSHPGTIVLSLPYYSDR
jgi:hypothetical protein